jgi:hypothetical protein
MPGSASRIRASLRQLQCRHHAQAGRQRLVPGPRGVGIGFAEHDEISASAFYQAGGGRLRCAFLVVSLRAWASGVAAPMRRSTAIPTNSTGEAQKLAGVGVRRASWLRRPALSPRNPKQNLPSGRQVPTMSQFFHMVPFMKHDAGFGVLTGNGIETRSFRAGDVIFQEGDNALDLFVIKSGQVRIQIGNRTVTELSPDTIFGEMALIDDEPRSATAIAVSDVELVSVSEKQFLFLVGQTPYFALKVMRVLAQRLRQTNKTLS